MCVMQCSVCSLKRIGAGAAAGEVCIGGGGGNERPGSDRVT